MIDFKDYQDKKAKGLISLVKTDVNPDNPEAVTYAVATKKFDPATGERLPDEVVGVSQKDLEEKRAELVEELAQLDAFVVEAKAL